MLFFERLDCGWTEIGSGSEPGSSLVAMVDGRGGEKNICFPRSVCYYSGVGTIGGSSDTDWFDGY